ncbi:MAG TPA: glycosyltransferase family 4 protein [Sedimentisphaerales bacterium]|nr:glycosyltransferase family 4 protein [Sedimentisphaerales bacterium]
MKVLMLNHEFPPVGGGASSVTFELSRQLVRTGHSVDVVTMHYDNLPRFETVEGVNIYRTPAVRRKPDICYTHEMATYILGALIKTIGLAKRNRYDIIHCHFIIPAGPLAWLVSKVADIPFLITSHGSDVPGHNPDRFTIAHRLIAPLWRFLAKRPALLTAPSGSLKALIEKKCPDARVHVIPNGIYTERFKPAEKTKSILMCSRIYSFKGFQYAIEALKDIDTQWQVNIAGEGPYLPQLKRLAEGWRPSIKFWGWLNRDGAELKNLYESSSIFILPSEAESFGLVIAEAMSAGNAVIASDIPAHREVLADTGLYVETRNPQQIRTQLQKLISNGNLCRELGEKARLRVRENFDWSIVVKKYLDCYHTVLGTVKA